MKDVPKGAGGSVDGPETAGIQARMRESGVETVSELHDLYGKRITFDGVAGRIDYAVGERFRASLEDGRQPYGVIAGITGAGDSLSYTSEGA